MDRHARRSDRPLRGYLSCSRKRDSPGGTSYSSLALPRNSAARRPSARRARWPCFCSGSSTRRASSSRGPRSRGFSSPGERASVRTLPARRSYRVRRSRFARAQPQRQRRFPRQRPDRHGGETVRYPATPREGLIRRGFKHRHPVGNCVPPLAGTARTDRTGRQMPPACRSGHAIGKQSSKAFNASRLPCFPRPT